MGPKTMLISNVANLPEQTMLVFVTVAALHLMWVVAFFLLPLLVTLVIDHLVPIFIWVKLVVLVVLMMLQRRPSKGADRKYGNGIDGLICVSILCTFRSLLILTLDSHSLKQQSN